MNKILWCLTNKLDASFFSPPFSFILKRRFVVSRGDVISMCIKFKSQVSWKREGVKNTIISFYSVLSIPWVLVSQNVSLRQQPASHGLIRNTECQAHPDCLNPSILTRS